MSAMLQSALYRPGLFVVFLCQIAVFLQCRALDFHQERNIRLSRPVRARCLQNCVVIKPLSGNNKILSRQSCYEECLLRMMKQRVVGTPHFKPFSKRIRRGTSNDIQDQQECLNGTEGGTAISKYAINVFFYELGNTGRRYVNVSWKPLHNKTVNWTGYKMTYLIQGSNKYSCRYLEKNVTSSIINNSSKGILKGLYVSLMITSVPYLSGNSDWNDWKAVKEGTGAVTSATPSLTTDETVQSTTFPTSVTSDTPFLTTDETVQSTTFPTSDSRKDYIKVAVPVVLVVTVLIGVAVFLYVRRARKFSTPDPEFQPEFDAFIIYSSEDKTFVTETLLPTLEKKHGFKCCIHYRDFTIGAPFRDNMVESVYKSKKTVAVVSRNFFNSRYCGSELSIALHRLLQRGDDSVIVLKLDDVKESKLPSALKKRSYIDYHCTHRQTWETRLVKCLTASNRTQAFHPTAL